VSPDQLLTWGLVALLVISLLLLVLLIALANALR
jgi:hypothetical protein